MLASVTLNVICIVMIVCHSNAEPNGQNKTNEEPSAVEGSQGYIIVTGGRNHTDSIVSCASCYAYDIASDIWKSIPNLPYSVEGPGSVTYKEKVYIAGGYYKSGLNNVAVLTSSGWIEGPLLTTMGFDKAIMVATNDSMYVTGCYSKHIEKLSCRDAAIAWHPGWQPMADSSKLHYYAAGAELNGFIYVCGAGITISNYCERYSTQNNIWEAIKPMNLARNFFEMVSLNGKLYVFGGTKGQNEMYDPDLDTWTFFSSLSGQMYFAAAATDGEKIYLIGGSLGVDGVQATNLVDAVNVYLPKSDIWLSKRSYPNVVAYAAATFLKSLP